MDGFEVQAEEKSSLRGRLRVREREREGRKRESE